MPDELQDQIVATEDPPTDIEWRSAERYEATSIPEVEIVEDSHAYEHPDTRLHHRQSHLAMGNTRRQHLRRR